MTQRTIYACDDNGYASHKIAWFNEKEQRIITTKIDTVIGAGHQTTDTVDGVIDGYTVMDGGESKTFTCSMQLQNVEEMRQSEYPLSIENRVLFTHALAQAKLLNNPLSMSVTLPFDDYYLPNGTVNQDVIDRVVENFKMNNIRCDGGPFKGKTANVTSMRVSPEAVAAWFDWAMDEHGNVNENFEEMAEDQGSVLVVDVGGKTTDIVALALGNNNSLIVLNGKSGTNDVGVLDLQDWLAERFKADLIEKKIISQSGHDKLFSAQQLKQMLERGKVRFGGQSYDVSEIREEGIQIVVSRILNFIRSKAGNTLAYHSIIVAGGGSLIFKDALQKHLGSNITILDEFANARGALKLQLSMRDDT